MRERSRPAVGVEMAPWHDRPRPIDIRHVEWPAADGPRSMEAAPETRVAAGRRTLPDDPILHTIVLTYASDMTLARHADPPPPRQLVRPHHGSWPASTTRCGSTGRAAPTSWPLYAQDSPNATEGGGCRGVWCSPGRDAGGDGDAGGPHPHACASSAHPAGRSPVGGSVPADETSPALVCVAVVVVGACGEDDGRQRQPSGPTVPSTSSTRRGPRTRPPEARGGAAGRTSA